MPPPLDTVIGDRHEHLESGARRVSLGAMLALAVSSMPESAAAAPPQTSDRSVSAWRSVSEPAKPHRLNWSYGRFSDWDYASSTAISIVGLYLEFGIRRDFPDRGWNSGILFDYSVRRGFVASSRAGRDRAAALSDYFWYAPQYYPILIDGLFVPLATDRWNFEVAWQISMINWQAEALAGTLTRLSHRTVGRARPSLQECTGNPEYSVDCDPAAEERTASFISGHTSMAMTGAGLVCAHHEALPLYGGGIADDLACAVALAAASTNGVLRMMADQHWPTDVMAGVVIGIGTGYAMPSLLHYRSGQPEPLGAGLVPRNTTLLPMVSDHVMGVTWLGLF